MLLDRRWHDLVKLEPLHHRGDGTRVLLQSESDGRADETKPCIGNKMGNRRLECESRI